MLVCLQAPSSLSCDTAVVAASDGPYSWNEPLCLFGVNVLFAWALPCWQYKTAQIKHHQGASSSLLQCCLGAGTPSSLFSVLSQPYFAQYVRSIAVWHRASTCQLLLLRCPTGGNLNIDVRKYAVTIIAMSLLIANALVIVSQKDENDLAGRDRKVAEQWPNRTQDPQAACGAQHRPDVDT